jgi:hypothetical protein
MTPQFFNNDGCRILALDLSDAVPATWVGSTATASSVGASPLLCLFRA